MLPASPVWKGGVEGSYLKMANFLSGKPRPGGRGGFTLKWRLLLPVADLDDLQKGSISPKVAVTENKISELLPHNVILQNPEFR
jgi:hypothetical protein